MKKRSTRLGKLFGPRAARRRQSHGIGCVHEALRGTIDAWSRLKRGASIKLDDSVRLRGGGVAAARRFTHLVWAGSIVLFAASFADFRQML